MRVRVYTEGQGLCEDRVVTGNDNRPVRLRIPDRPIYRSVEATFSLPARSEFFSLSHFEILFEYQINYSMYMSFPKYLYDFRKSKFFFKIILEQQQLVRYYNGLLLTKADGEGYLLKIWVRLSSCSYGLVVRADWTYHIGIFVET